MGGTLYNGTTEGAGEGDQAVRRGRKGVGGLAWHGMGQRGRPAVAQPRRERAGGACAHGRHRIGEVGWLPGGP
jgi:hypothetical protein